MITRSTDDNRKMTVDFAEETGRIRALNGVNLGPISMSGFLDLSEGHRQLMIPYTRLHDGPYAFPDCTDIHAVFPDFDADPEDPRNYRFSITDDYIQSILDVGSRVMFRLGESIEHSKRKYWVHPPKDYAKWAAICIQIIRHYNEGWADGFRHGIRYWEIWNEPWNMPDQWTGTSDEWFRFYEVTAKAIKQACPDILVGGPTLTASEDLAGTPSFGRSFLAHCRDTGAPLDFFSWHTYTGSPDSIPYWSRRLRNLVNEYGFIHAEMHLNEWNYFRPGSWNRANYEASAGIEGAAFDAAMLCAMQDLPIDEACFYWGKDGWFGLFDTFGSAARSFYAFLAFARMLDTPRRVRATGERIEDGRTILAGLAADQRMARILVANFKDEIGDTELTLNGLPWSQPTQIERAVLDATHSLGVTPPTAYSGSARAILVPDAPAEEGAVRTTVHAESAVGRPIVLREAIPAATVVLYTLMPKWSEAGELAGKTNQAR